LYLFRCPLLDINGWPHDVTRQTQLRLKLT
jgi:hypothetical protein